MLTGGLRTTVQQSRKPNPGSRKNRKSRRRMLTGGLRTTVQQSRKPNLGSRKNRKSRMRMLTPDLETMGRQTRRLKLPSRRVKRLMMPSPMEISSKTPSQSRRVTNGPREPQLERYLLCTARTKVAVTMFLLLPQQRKDALCAKPQQPQLSRTKTLKLMVWIQLLNLRHLLATSSQSTNQSSKLKLAKGPQSFTKAAREHLRRRSMKRQGRLIKRSSPRSEY